ncbi:site-2 protease family protein [Pigmentibacter ruber]|uniref:site-2 protease family protein n=1 Tax=Pigmentibacter ruber TaxID=2683196 RepID=UPI00131AE4F9|nr:site-2 protease family protein [Pigmentibacter ruber]
MEFLYLDSKFSLPTAMLKYLGFLIAITMSQAAIAIVARKKGDTSAQTSQMATLNPLPHIELFGTVLFPFFTILLNSPIVFGWPKQFNIETRYFKRIKRDINLVYSSGILINFLIALICTIVLKIMGNIIIPQGADYSSPEILSRMILSYICFLNIIIGALNLLPVPGTPGWYILINNLSYDLSRKVQEKAMFMTVGFIILIMSGLLSFYFELFLNLFRAINML